jgi:predicted TPR repeat methyltransferase
VDLGCGTGLVAGALQGVGALAGVEIVGVDLSPRMLEIAASRGAYSKLEQGDMADILVRLDAGSIHAAIAADAFIYVGDLAPIFSAVARALAPHGLFAFSVEAAPGDQFVLQPNGRYAHSPAYLRALAAKFGLQERRMEATRIRLEGASQVEGWLALFERA